MSLRLVDGCDGSVDRGDGVSLWLLRDVLVIGMGWISEVRLRWVPGVWVRGVVCVVLWIDAWLGNLAPVALRLLHRSVNDMGVMLCAVIC